MRRVCFQLQVKPDPDRLSTRNGTAAVWPRHARARWPTPVAAATTRIFLRADGLLIGYLRDPVD